jgi:uncharacterized protein (TIGR01244 family)
MEHATARRRVEIDGDARLMAALEEPLRDALAGTRGVYHVRLESVGRGGETMVAVDGRSGRVPLLFDPADDAAHVASVVRRTVERFALCLAFLFFGIGVAAGEGLPTSVAPQLIPNYTLAVPDVAAAGAPTEAGLAQLAELGFRIVVDLRAADEGVAERAALEAAGLRYVSIPIDARTFSREDVAAVARVLDEDGRGPVLLHCATANRVGGVWTVLEVMKGRPYEEAEAEGRRIGLRSKEMKDAVKRVLGIDPPTK